MFHTSIATALQSEQFAVEHHSFRSVEDQSFIATNSLTENLLEQQVLEEALEDFKPPIPDECASLHFLYLTPFRYFPYRGNSRFRREGFTEGVLYSAESEVVAVAEAVKMELRFFQDSPETNFPTRVKQRSTFPVSIASPAALDLTKGVLGMHQEKWISPSYDACQSLAEQAREAGVSALFYRSSLHDFAARLGESDKNVATLDCSIIKNQQPTLRNWAITFHASSISVAEIYGDRRFELPLSV